MFRKVFADFNYLGDVVVPNTLEYPLHHIQPVKYAFFPVMLGFNFIIWSPICIELLQSDWLISWFIICANKQFPRYT